MEPAAPNDSIPGAFSTTATRSHCAPLGILSHGRNRIKGWVGEPERPGPTGLLVISADIERFDCTAQNAPGLS